MSFADSWYWASCALLLLTLHFSMFSFYPPLSFSLSLSWAPSRPSWAPDSSSFCWSTAFTLGLDMSCSSTLEAPSPPSSSPSLQCPDLLHNKVETETNIGVTLCKGENVWKCTVMVCIKSTYCVLTQRLGWYQDRKQRLKHNEFTWIY